MALIHLERVWADNRFTAEGNLLHKRAHDGHDEIRSDLSITRTLPVRSFQLGISGQCDIVEFHKSGEIIPIEYKRGKPKTNSIDEVQLCAQALSLEEMLNAQIPHGFIYYGLKKRRTQIDFNSELRQLTVHTAQALHRLIDARQTPPANYDAKKCSTCSLLDLCQPKTQRLKRGASAWFQAQIEKLAP
jgi:CRISPR-associated exonuclease Cas4